MNKRKFLIIHDYQHGGFGFIALARTKQELEAVLGPNDEVIEEDIENHPLVKYLGERIEIGDIDDPKGLLKASIESAKGYFSKK